MQKLVNIIEKGKPFFEKVSSNKYLRAIRDGFISLMPIILFSSIFLLIAFVPNIWKFYWPKNVENNIMMAYNYSMGVFGLLAAGTVVKSLVENFNTKLPATTQINHISAMAASMIGFLLVSVTSIVTKDGLATFDTSYMGTKGLLTAFLVAFVTGHIYNFCVRKNLTIKMPEEVPSNISQTFKDLIPMALVVIFFWVFNLAFRQYIYHDGLAAYIIDVFKPIFKAADGYGGLALIFGAMAFFWFVGIHGPSIVEPAVSAIYLTNVEQNIHLIQHHEHATYALAQGTQYFVAAMGGTGATLVITWMITLMAKSKQLKAIGKASVIPVAFGINEPVLFGIPLVLNPVFMVPFILTPIVNVCTFKLFIDLFHMNGFSFNLPWTTPSPIGLFVGTGFAILSVVLFALLILLDFLIYYPFFKYYDKTLVESEAKVKHNKDSEKNEENHEELNFDNLNIKDLKVLVLCANGATSGMLATAIKKGAREKNIDVESNAMAYGQHRDIIGNYDLCVLAPQIASMYEDLEKATKDIKTKIVTTSGPEYVKLTRSPEDALQYAFDQIKGE